MHAYFAASQGRVAIGTSFRAVASAASARKLDWIGLTGFFGFGFLPDDRTFYDDVRILLPATHYVFGSRGPSPRQPDRDPDQRGPGFALHGGGGRRSEVRGQRSEVSLPRRSAKRGGGRSADGVRVGWLGWRTAEVRTAAGTVDSAPGTTGLPVNRRSLLSLSPVVLWSGSPVVRLSHRRTFAEQTVARGHGPRSHRQTHGPNVNNRFC